MLYFCKLDIFYPSIDCIPADPPSFPPTPTWFLLYHCKLFQSKIAFCLYDQITFKGRIIRGPTSRLTEEVNMSKLLPQWMGWDRGSTIVPPLLIAMNICIKFEPKIILSHKPEDLQRKLKCQIYHIVPCYMIHVIHTHALRDTIYIWFPLCKHSFLCITNGSIHWFSLKEQVTVHGPN